MHGWSNLSQYKLCYRYKNASTFFPSTSYTYLFTVWPCTQELSLSHIFNNLSGTNFPRSVEEDAWYGTKEGKIVFNDFYLQMIKKINMYLGTEQDGSLIDVWMAYVEGEHETVSESIQTLFTATAEDNYKILVVCTGFFCPKHEPSPTA